LKGQRGQLSSGIGAGLWSRKERQRSASPLARQRSPVLIKALWGIVIAMISYVLIISGGQDAIRSLFTLKARPWCL